MLKKRFETFIDDSDRYETDMYELLAALTEHDDGKISVVFHIGAAQLGTTSGAEYWHFDKKEQALAEKVYEEIVETTKTMTKKIEQERLQMSLVMPMFRTAMQGIAPEYKEKSGVAWFNHYTLYQGKEPDWRQTLYGNRYPKQKNDPVITIYNYADEKKIETNGTRRGLKYKYKY